MAGTFDANQLRKGTIYKKDGNTLVVLDYKHIKMGRTPATIRVKVKNIVSGSITEITYGSSDKVEDADVAKRSAQFLYSDGSKLYFMDNEDYSQFELPTEDLGGQEGFLKEGERVVTMYLDGRPISVELPASVELEVTLASDAVAGDSSNNPTKKVKLETGIEINVPLFIKQGEKIKVNTETGEYVGRASGS
ncbi:elongation factor P [Candidatus Dojkabacteria bacterium]|uniref:Elongation factor P n=1 Tax=Candidatus Dojkabacteria bacterium TaxID=2099670 RepID=A0A955KZ26_9BACT|nr:elongation factor P [Candidatus Dojkabacteria bacterium]